MPREGSIAHVGGDRLSWLPDRADEMQEQFASRDFFSFAGTGGGAAARTGDWRWQAFGEHRFDVRTGAFDVDTDRSGCGCPACSGASPSEPQFFVPPTSGTAPNGLPIYNWDQAAAQLTRDSNGWANSTISYAFRSTSPGDLPDDAAGFSRFNAAQILAAETALQLWADVAGITFVRAGSGASGEGAYSNNATILFANYSSGVDGAAAFAFLPGSAATQGVAFEHGDIWVNISLAENQDLTLGGIGIHTLTGGLGNDRFVFRIAEGSDTVTDFVAGNTSGDVVQVSSFGAAFDTFGEVIAAASQVAADVVINFGGGQTLTLQNVTLGNLNSGDFVFGV